MRQTQWRSRTVNGKVPQRTEEQEMLRRMDEIEVKLPQIVLERADATYAQIRQQAVQEQRQTAGVSGNGCRQGQAP